MAKIYIDNSSYMEFIDEIATKMMELEFEEYYKNTGFDNLEDKTYCLTDEAQDFFNEKYDEIETILNKTLNIYSNNELINDN